MMDERGWREREKRGEMWREFGRECVLNWRICWRIFVSFFLIKHTKPIHAKISRQYHATNHTTIHAQMHAIAHAISRQNNSRHANIHNKIHSLPHPSPTFAHKHMSRCSRDWTLPSEISGLVGLSLPQVGPCGLPRARNMR